MKLYYFIDKEGHRQGPLPLDDLKAFEITPQTLVWSKGMEKWAKAKDLDDFRALFLGNIAPAGNNAVESSKPSNPQPVDEDVEEEEDVDNDLDNDEEEEIEETAETGNKKTWIIIVVVILLAASAFIGFKTCSSSQFAGDSLAADTVMLDTIPDESINENDLIMEFLTSMYNHQLFNEYRFLERHCTSHLLKVLEEGYEYDGSGYAVWFFRTNSQDVKPESDAENKIISVEAIGDGWFTYEFYDGGWKGKKRVKASVVDGEVMMDVLETVFDEYTELYSSGIIKDWSLSGYMESDGTRYPVLITFHQQGENCTNCIFKNVNYGGKFPMEATVEETTLQFKGYDGSNELVIQLELNDEGNAWEGYSTIGDQTYFTHLEE